MSDQREARELILATLASLSYPEDQVYAFQEDQVDAILAALVEAGYQVGRYEQAGWIDIGHTPYSTDFYPIDATFKAGAEVEPVFRQVEQETP